MPPAWARALAGTNIEQVTQTGLLQVGVSPAGISVALSIVADKPPGTTVTYFLCVTCPTGTRRGGLNHPPALGQCQ